MLQKRASKCYKQPKAMANRCFVQRQPRPSEKCYAPLPTALTEDLGTWGTLRCARRMTRHPLPQGAGPHRGGRHVNWSAWAAGMGGCMAVGIAETDPADPPFPAAAAALIEDRLEQRGFPPINILLRWKEQFIPPRVIASRLSVNAGETLHLVQVFRLSVAVERTGP